MVRCSNQKSKLERPSLHIHLPRSGEQDTATVDEDRRLLMGGSVCFGKFMVDVESLSHAAEKCIKDNDIQTTVD
jgi:hypothetical protein